MSLLENWFSKKTRDTRPAAGIASAAKVPEDVAVHDAGSRRQKRMALRELLYAIVRQTMVRAGILSAGYSFKVLSLEPQGRAYIIMMDLAPGFALSDARQAEMEKQIAAQAQARHAIRVSAVYWRINERLRGGARNMPQAAVHAATPYRIEPIGADEVAALRQALALGMNAATASGFEDTEVIVNRHPYPALSRTQYGDLN